MVSTDNTMLDCEGSPLLLPTTRSSSSSSGPASSTTTTPPTDRHGSSYSNVFSVRGLLRPIVVGCIVFAIGTTLYHHHHQQQQQQSREVINLPTPSLEGLPHHQEDITVTASQHSFKLRPASKYTREAQADRITDLPGLNQSLYEQNFNMFSGYLTVSETNKRYIFYWYVESQGNPEQDPVVFWTNGGPGCSGLLGFGMEHGPFHISADGALTPNPYSWNKVANMLYVESPPGVGFSYSETPSDTVNIGDEETASDNVVAIIRFLRKFPERISNDFYIASESYGGHYIPQLAKKIVDRLGTPDFVVNFKGFLVGNPAVDPFTNDVAQVRDFFQHGLISLSMLDEWLAKCSDRSNYDNQACADGIAKMHKRMQDISPYALDYPICTEDKVDLDDVASSQLLHFLSITANRDEYPYRNHIPRFLPPDEKYLPCAEAHLEVYLNQVVVQQAINVRNAPVRWHPCVTDSASTAGAIQG